VEEISMNSSIELRPLFSIFLEVPDSLVVGKTPAGLFRRLTPVIGGSFTGDRLSGQVISGNDAVLVRDDGTARIDCRCVLQTVDGEALFMTYQGLRTPPRQARAAAGAIESVVPGTEYFRCAFQFETASEPLAWINDIIAVGAGRREPDGPWYDVFEVT
jgi:hypothetical protein